MSTLNSVVKRLWTLIPALAAAAALRAAEPLPLSYQGQLTDANGTPRHGSHLMVFGIYEASTGGSPLFTDSQNVSVSSGAFSVLIGAGTLGGSQNLSQVLTGGTERYLQISVDGNALLPRQRLAASPYALSGAATTGKRINVSNAAANITALTIQDASFVKIVPTIDSFGLSGIAGGVDGRTVSLYNVTNNDGDEATDTVTVLNLSGAASPANRIRTGTGANLTATGECAITLTYDGEQQVWVVTSFQP